jgi:hypothetical protein
VISSRVSAKSGITSCGVDNHVLIHSLDRLRSWTIDSKEGACSLLAWYGAMAWQDEHHYHAIYPYFTVMQLHSDNWATLCETLPSSIPFTFPKPRLPITITSAL